MGRSAGEPEGVRGGSITITEQGIPVAEIRPLPKDRREPYSNGTDELEQHIEEMCRRGVLQLTKEPRQPFKPGPHIPGALDRFLEQRG